MKKYIKPKMEIIEFDAEDIITDSGEDLYSYEDAVPDLVEELG